MIGLMLLIVSEIFRILPLKVSGLVVLAAFFAINSRLLVKRIEALENGKKIK